MIRALNPFPRSLDRGRSEVSRYIAARSSTRLQLGGASLPWSASSFSGRSSPRPSPSSWCWRARSATSCCRSRSSPTSRRRRSSSARVYPGASAQVVADTVTTPLEQQINGVAGHDLHVLVELQRRLVDDHHHLRRRLSARASPRSTCRTASSQAASSLPAIVNQAGVTIKKQNPNFVLIVNLTSPDSSVDPVALSNYAYLQIVDPLKRLPGVGDVADLRRAALLHAHLARSRQARQSRHHRRRRAETPSPSRTCRSPPARSASRRRRRARLSRCRSTRSGGLSDPDQFGDIVVRANPAAGVGGAAARCRADRARRAAIRVDGLLRRRPDRGAGDLPDAGLERARPAAAASRTRWRSCRSASPRASPTRCTTTRPASSRPPCTTCVITLAEALLLVVAVVFIFLQSWRTTIIPTIAIPVSLIATLAVMETARLLAQHAEPARHGAGDRPRRRRRDRRGRERRAAARGGPAAARGGARRR